MDLRSLTYPAAHIERAWIGSSSLRDPELERQFTKWMDD